MLKKIFAGAIRYATRKVAAAKILFLERAADVYARRMLKVLKVSLYQRYSAAEILAISKAEARRANLEASSALIEMIDYGAGAPGEHRAVSEMERGVISQDRVGVVCKRASKSPFWATLLFGLIREY